MKVRRILCFLNLLLILISFQTVFSQTAGKNKIIYSFNDKGGKIALTTRPRIFSGAMVEKTKETVAKKIVSIFELEHQVFDLVNQKRIEAGLQPLEWDEDIAKIARLHSQNMADNNFFSHTGLDGKMVSSRADSAGIRKWHSIGENIAYNRGYSEPTECAVEKWMLSPGHRENILKDNWQQSGIGVAVTTSGTYYFTQVFLRK